MPISEYVHLLSNKTKGLMILDILERDSSLAIKSLQEMALNKNQKLVEDFFPLFTKQYFHWLEDKDKTIDLAHYTNEFFLSFQNLLIDSLEEQVKKEPTLTYQKIAKQYGLAIMPSLDKNIVLELAQKQKDKSQIKWLTDIMEKDCRGMLSFPIILTEENAQMIKDVFFNLPSSTQALYLTKTNLFTLIKEELPKTYLKEQDCDVYNVNYKNDESDVIYRVMLILNNLKQESAPLEDIEHIINQSAVKERSMIKRCLERNIVSNFSNFDKILIFINPNTIAKFEYLAKKIKFDYVECCKCSLEKDLQNLVYSFFDRKTAYEDIQKFSNYYLSKSAKNDCLLEDSYILNAVDGLYKLKLFDVETLPVLASLLKLTSLNDKKQDDKTLVKKFFDLLVENEKDTADCFSFEVAGIDKNSKKTDAEIVNMLIHQFEKSILEWSLTSNNVKITNKKLKI